MVFFGTPTLPKDTFEFNQLKFFLTYDKNEKITEWNYSDPNGVRQDLEFVGEQVLGMTLEQAWMKSASFKGDAHAVYWQLGRLLGFWIQDFHNSLYEELVCRCFNVPKALVLKNLIEENHFDLLSIGKATKAGLGCGSCHKNIAQTIQDYCDLNAVVIDNKSKPKGINPIVFVLELDNKIARWKAEKYPKFKIEIKGIKDYTLYAQWEQQDDAIVEELKQSLLQSASLKLEFINTMISCS